VGQSNTVDLQAGESGWLRSVRIILFMLALLQLIVANTPPAWKLITILCLLLVFVLISWKIHQLAPIQLLRLHRNGMVTLVQRDGQEIPAVLEGEAWVSTWVSVLPVGRFDRWPRQQLLVCRSKNHPDHYRHLLMLLRLGAVDGAADDSLTGIIRQTASGAHVKRRITDIMRE
jgi:hypothetical protein